jgi:predicted membrane protein DUF2207
LLLALLALLAAAGPAAGQGSFSIDKFTVSLEVHADRSLTVREAITVAFRGHHSGIYRVIPLRTTVGAAGRVLRLEDVHVFDEARSPLRAELTWIGDAARIKAWVPGASDAVRTVTIFYRVRQALLARADSDELEWNVTGTGWDVPIEAAEAFVTGPPGDLPAPLRTAAWTGPLGGRGSDYTEERAERLIIFRTTRPLRPREGLTVVVGWPRGSVAGPSAWQRARWFVGDNWPLGMPVLGLVLMLGLWQRGRDQRQSIKPEYEPPPGLIPAEAGALADELARPRHVIATLVDLAVRGYLHIEQVTTAFGTTDYLFKRLKPVVGDPGLRSVEVFTLARFFRDDWALNLRLLSEVEHEYDHTFPPIREEIYRSLVADRLFPVSPGLVRTLWAGVGLGLVGLAGLAYLLAPEWLGPEPWLLPFGLAASGAVVLVLSPLMPRRTSAGVRALARVRGFQEFLRRAEKDRLERLPGDTLHRWLPWAIALGVTEHWIFGFQGLKVDPPTWFTGRDGFSLDTYHRDFSAFDRQTVAAILARSGPSVIAALGSGPSPGGSSGGGLGGGGGGTF